MQLTEKRAIALINMYLEDLVNDPSFGPFVDGARLNEREDNMEIWEAYLGQYDLEYLFKIGIIGDLYQVSIMPRFIVNVKACLMPGVPCDGNEDAVIDGAEEAAYDYLGQRTVTCHPKTYTKDVVVEKVGDPIDMFDAALLTWWNENPRKDSSGFKDYKECIVWFYTINYEVDAVMDSTLKNVAKLLIKGLSPITYEYALGNLFETEKGNPQDLIEALNEAY